MWIVRLALNRPYTFVAGALVLLMLTPFVLSRTPTHSSFAGLSIGLVMAMVLIYFVLVVNFQSWLDLPSSRTRAATARVPWRPCPMFPYEPVRNQPH